MLLAFNGPILKYLFPVLVGYAGGNAIFPAFGAGLIAPQLRAASSPFSP